MAATSSVADLIASVRKAGGTICTDGDIIELAAPVPLPPDLVARIRQAKPEILVALSTRNDLAFKSGKAEPEDGAWWRREFTILSLRWLVAGRSKEETEQLAFNRLVVEWHKRHGERVPRHQCAGCGAPIGDVASLDFQDGNRVHFDARLDCLGRYGKRWRGWR